MKPRRHSIYLRLLLPSFLMALLTACSATRLVPDDDQLYIGIKRIDYHDFTKSPHFSSTKEEVEAALDCAPNGALFGSSSHRTPFPYGLWIWNAYSEKTSGFAKWMTSSFGKAPVLMSWVNPALRSQVAQSVLKNHGYFHGVVDYEVIAQKNPRKAKVGYTISPGTLFTYDSIAYQNFPPEAQALIDSTRSESLIKPGDPFDVSSLDAERARISYLFRNNGYYYYQPSYASYLADTTQVPGKVQLRLQLADSIPSEAQRKWIVGKLDIQLRRTFMEQLADSLQRRRFTLHFNGKHSPIRPRVIMKDMKLRPGQMYNYDSYVESANKLSSTGIFSMVDFQFSRRNRPSAPHYLSPDTLDLQLNCVFDKPYDFYVETTAKGKSTGFMGPALTVGFTKRNAFRGGEKLDINLHGSYEWQLTGNRKASGSEFNSYEYGGDASLELPRLLLPFRYRRRWFSTPTTLIKASSTVVNRSHYFKRRVVSGEITYTFQPKATTRHQFSPLVMEYDYMKSATDSFMAILHNNPYLLMAMQDQFVPKMRYTFSYHQPTNTRHPISWETTVSESANLLSLAYTAFGKSWNEHDKKLFKNPYAQFLKIETDFKKTWTLSDHSQLVGHVNAGVGWAFGNSKMLPYTEQFYVGGANSIRAFTVRSIGPGRFRADDSWLSYVLQTGDVKLQANLEYRPRLFGNLYGAVFLDAGNVWELNDVMDQEDDASRSHFHLKDLGRDLALGTGVGLRYDLDFFVIRLDWGIGLHVPYSTSKRGYFNLPNFRDGQSLHLAIGYPF